MDNYKHHLFFKARDLTDKERNKIRQHFLRKRDSGGGDCGMIEKIGDNAYKISFKEKEDQERVLQRKFHTISFPSGELRLTVSRTNQSQGPENVVQSGAPKHDELKKKVMEKRVYLPTDLITFITSSGAISKYQARFQQSFRNPVSLDLGSELVLSSVCSDDLDEAMAVVLRDLSVANVELQGAAAVPPDLDRVKEIMIKAKNEANCRELRVDVSFIPGPNGTIKVRLLGYNEDVNKLKEVLHEYQMNQVGIQEMLKLPFPELVDCFDTFLNMTDVKQNRVTLKPSHVPYPCVLVSGPRCLVKEVQAELSKALSSLSSDRLVLDGPGARQYFRAEGKVSKELVESSCHVLIREQQGSVPRLPQVQQQQQQQLPLSFVGTLHTTSTSQQSVFLFLGHSRKDVDVAMTKLKELYQAQCSTQTFKKEELAGLTPDNMKDLKQLVESQGLYMRMCGQDSLTVSGLKDGVNKVMQMIIASLQGSLKRERRVRAELKHIVTISDFTFPTYWDNMGNDENLKVVVLHPSSSEYRTVKEAFTRTVSKTVMKIERLQNVYLRRAYEVQKKNLSDKNKQKGGAGEKLLYHGTTKDNCDSIMKTGFNRSFAGQNATVFGHGTYFAVIANYSASYARPAADGTQSMFVARVLTGIYTQGRSDMKVPPLRTDLRSNDRYDSVVDNMNNPNMYVVFHDNQAYPDYLITFK